MFSLIQNIEDKIYKTDDEQKILNFWISGMNKKKIDNDKFKDLQCFINQILEIKTFDDISKLCGYLHNFNVSILFDIGAHPDSKKSDFVIPHMYVSGLNLPDRDYYIKKENSKIFGEYRIFLCDLMKLLDLKLDNPSPDLNKTADYNTKTIDYYVDNILLLEKDIANTVLSKTELRDPDLTYNKLSFKQLEKITKNFDWNMYFEASNIPKEELIIDQIDFVKKLDKILEKYEINTIKVYILTRFIINFLPYLDEKSDLLYFNFTSKITGQLKPKERKKRMLGWLNNNLGEIVGKKYVKEYFSQQKNRHVNQ